AFVAGLVVVVALLGGIVVAMLALVRARAAEAKAVAVTRFLEDALAAADPAAGRDRDVTVRQTLAAARDKAEAELGGQPEVLGAVLNTIGRTYIGLGNLDEAEPVLRRALAI